MYERENKRKEGEEKEREGKIRDPFVMGDMRMHEKEGTMVVE